jgi:drug/metabolite transporter (DMT)-like permease
VTSIAFALVLASAALHAVWSVSIKGSRDPVLFNLLQSIPGAVLAAGLLAAVPSLRVPDADFWSWVAVASVCHGLYMYWMGRALRVADLSVVYPIARSTPAILPFFAVPLLGEEISPLGMLAIATVVSGMWLVQTRGRFSLASFAVPGAAFAVLTLLATVGYGITDKAAMLALDRASLDSWTAPVPRSIFYGLLTSLGGTVVMLPGIALERFGKRGGALDFSLATMRSELPRALGAFAISLVGYSLILEALRTAQASYVVAVRQSSVLFAVALGVLWLGERPGRARILGACVIAAGVVLLGFAQ